RRDKRRTHYKLRAPSTTKCSHCGQLKISHRVCDNCGYYGGTEVRQPAE
ncbi:MAG TPA: 50S ribosomal protein L32, partial [Fibrobacteria bacterium]|nr:50S ribosomal protein L32 [Fibrobacteria bacterium]